MLEKFWNNVAFIPFHECWEWIGNKNHFGYGRIQMSKKTHKAHRLSWELHHKQKVPDGMFVCHSCDNPGCVNPEHLWIGTAAENNKDRNRKGRANMPKGHIHWKKKLNETDITEIRSSTLSSRKLGQIYHVSHKNILAIKNGKTWKHV